MRKIFNVGEDQYKRNIFVCKRILIKEKTYQVKAHQYKRKIFNENIYTREKYLKRTLIQDRNTKEQSKEFSIPNNLINPFKF